MPLVIHGDILCLLKHEWESIGYENLSMNPEEFVNCDSDHHCYHPTS